MAQDRTEDCSGCGRAFLPEYLRRVSGRRYCHDCWLEEQWKTENGLRETDRPTASPREFLYLLATFTMLVWIAWWAISLLV